jgi:hypothetical protein
VQWKPEFGPARSEWAILEDICASGACLEIEEPIALDTLVSLQFEQGYRWSRRRFKPEHLIQFRLRQVRQNR